jgi:hypothetical protein
MNEIKLDGYARDKNSYALLNIDAEAFNEYKRQRESLMKFNSIQQEVTELKNDMGEIKSLLNKILNGISNV